MINSEIAYFDPNTYGECGYSLIGPLLLFYKKLVIYGPVGYLIEKSYENENLRKTSLTPDEFIGYIEKNIIIPLGFETFFNKNERSRLYLPELRVTTDFDNDLISSPCLSDKTFSVPNKFKYDVSPVMAVDILRKHQHIRERLLAEVQRGENLPQRYKDLKQRVDLIPQHLKEVVNKVVNTVEPEEIMPYVIIYDLLNNKHVMVSQGSATVHSQHMDFREIYRMIHGFDEHQKAKSQQIEIIAEVLKTCVSEITYERLTSEQIDEFRTQHRDSFVSFIESAFQEFEDMADFFKKKEAIKEVISERITNMKIHLSIGPEKLISMVPSLKVISEPISSLLFDGNPGSVRRKIYHALHQPLMPADRWVYHFLKLRK
ncbi:MAG: hypothetical protein KDJ34_08055 [Candidatus Competibacteraceae bacterium]|nr:hypothetical protein [Candidatus Competibacteraceae bacterium]